MGEEEKKKWYAFQLAKNQIFLPFAVQCFVAPLKTLCLSKNSREIDSDPHPAKVHTVACQWMTSSSLGLKSTCFYFQLCTSSSAFSPKVSYTEKNLKIVFSSVPYMKPVLAYISHQAQC